MIGDGVITSGGVFVRAEQPWADARLARLFDAFPFEDDLPLYLDLARSQGPRVLEVACGSGRVLLRLARGGFDVVGVDVSPHMLALARAKLDAQGIAVELVQQDMRELDLVERDFDLAIVATKSFAYLTERADQLQSLENIHAHLRRRGLLVLDLLHPRPEWVGAPCGLLRDDLVYTDPDRGVTVSRVESVVSCDVVRQVRITRSSYEVIDREGSIIEKRFVEWPYRWTYRFEAEHLLERAGFAVENVYGGYARETFTSESPAMIFLARKP